MRAASQAMSGAVDLCVTVLEQTLAPQLEVNGLDKPSANTDIAARNAASQMMALTTLRHVRDVLSGSAPTFDPSVMQPLRELSKEGEVAEVEYGRSGSSGVPLRPTATKTSRDRLAPTGPVDGLGAGFPRLEVASPPASMPAPTTNPGSSSTATQAPATLASNTTTSRLKAGERPLSSGLPPSGAKAREAFPPSPVSTSPPSADTKGDVYPPVRRPGAAPVPVTRSPSSERRPFDPLGVL